MRHEFWLERWRDGRIAFHQPRVDVDLIGHWADLGLNVKCPVFVPLCGKSLDLLWLRDRGHPVIGVELSTIAVEAFCVENGIDARRRTMPGFDCYQTPDLELLCGDFFDLTPALLANVGAVYDRAALISWNEALRQPYVEHLAALTGPGTETLLITLEYDQDQTAGPPFSVPAAEVDRLYSRHHAVRELSRQDILSSEPRMQARGVTELAAVCYRLTRL
jgi:thiopurine S-methyltransferase